jgi:hypothetical protein
VVLKRIVPAAGIVSCPLSAKDQARHEYSSPRQRPFLFGVQEPFLFSRKQRKEKWVLMYAEIIAKKKKGTNTRPSFLSGLLLNDRLGGALGSAGAALQALAGVDLVVELAHIDRLGGALGSAGAAGQALVRDHKSHDVTSVCRLTRRS